VISVIEGVETKLQCVASASKPKTQIDWIFQGKCSTRKYICKCAYRTINGTGCFELGTLDLLCKK